MAMVRAINQWLDDSHVEARGQLKLPYTAYGCMLLLSSNAFHTEEWREIRERCTLQDLHHLYRLIAKHLKATHIAINRPIPPSIDSERQQENVFRAPKNFLPLWGDFGPETCQPSPTQEDFNAAFWVNAKQNGIHQIWAPRWTMFSRGNISEKARLLTLPSVELAVAQGKADGAGRAAVDLYAGIGYFSFSYISAGIDRVLCWDINPWSTEGLRRGAAANKWSMAMHESNVSYDELVSKDARVLIFNESNEFAMKIIWHLQNQLPPITHVNCGLLPTSRRSWETAFAVLNRDLGGCIHIHENFDVKKIQQGAEAVRSAFQDMLNVLKLGEEVKIESIHQVKSYAPGVMHCVIDIHIPALRPG